MAVRVEHRQQRRAPFAAEAARIVRHLDFVLLARGRRPDRVRALGARARSRGTTCRATPTTSSFRQTINVAIGVVVLRARHAPRPGGLSPRSGPRSTASALVGARGGLRRRPDPRNAALDRHRLLPVPAVRARQGAPDPRARRRSSPTGRAASTSGGRRSRAVGLAAVPAVLVFVEPDFGTAIVYCAILAAVLFIGGTRWSQLAALAFGRCAVLVLDGLAAPVGGDRGAPAVPGRAPDRLLEPGLGPERRDLQHHASRSPRSARAGSTAEASPARRRRT